MSTVINNNPTIAAILLVLMLSVSAYTQDPHVRSEYKKDAKATVVETDLLYVKNDPQQFIQLSLMGRYKGEKLTKAADKINLSVWSVSKDALYRKSKDRELIVVTDGEEWSAGDLTHLVMKGETRNGKDAFYSENRPGLGMEVSVPATARVRTAGTVDGLTAEWLLTDMKMERFLKIAAAKTVEFRLGKTSFGFSENQMDTIRDFARRLNP